MTSLPTSVAENRKLVLAVAAPVEIVEVLAVFGVSGSPQNRIPEMWTRTKVADAVQLGTTRYSGVDLIHTGVSKSNAAGAVANLANPKTDGLILSVGAAGALPDQSGVFALRPRDTVVAQRCIFADEGIVTSSGYQDLTEMGFPIDAICKSAFACDSRAIAAFADAGAKRGDIATVSICSGTDEIASEIARRSSAIAETMEGAAVALVCKRLGIPFCEVRAISNYTGERSKQQWDIRGALAALRELLGRVIQPLDR